MTEQYFAIRVTSGDRFLCEWSGDLQAVEALYRQAYNKMGLDERDHHWAWDGCAREIVWDIVVNGVDPTDDTRAVLIWWIVHYSLGNVRVPVALCCFRRRFDIGARFVENLKRFTWVNVTPCTTPQIPPPGFVEFTVS